MSIVKIKDKTFKTSITQEEIQQRIKSLAARINEDMAGKNPLFLSVLNGSFMFTADLLRQVTIPCEVSFVKLASYDGVLSTGKITGRTMRKMLNSLTVRHPKEIHICTLFVKPEKLEEPLDIEYAAFSIPNDFIVGYGLDYDQQGRNLNEIYTLVE